MASVVLDAVEGFEVDLEKFSVKNLHAMIYLPKGIHGLATAVRTFENNMLTRFAASPAFMFAPGEFGAVANYAGWFSVSLVSYLRLVRLVALMAEKNWGTSNLSVADCKKEARDACMSYVKAVAPAVYQWRNKVGAHTAFSDPRGDDSLAMLEASMMMPVLWKSPYFWAGAWNWGAHGEQSNFEEWSVTKVFEDLAPRLWPQLQLQTLVQAPAS